MSEQAVFAALKCRIEITSGGTRRYYNNAGELHRDEGPAIEQVNGDKFWYQNGVPHRTDGNVHATLNPGTLTASG